MTISEITSYHRPTELRVALQLLREGRGSVRPLAGGTSLVGEPPRDVDAVVDLRDLQLNWINSQSEGGLSLGAMTTLADVMASDAARDYAGGILIEATQLAAGSLVRNQATIGGTLISRASTSDLVAVLLALGATVTLTTGQEQTVLLEDFYRRRDYLLQPGTLVTEVQMPPLPENARVALARIARTPMDQPILAVAAWTLWDGDRILEARLAATAFGGAPACLNAAGSALGGTEPGSEAFDAAVDRASEGLSIQGNHLASAGYRAAMLPVLVRRALARAAIR